MCDVKSLFCKYGETFIEGYLGDENSSPELLFVLKEPHASPDNVKDFWFKKNVMPDPNRMNNPYYKVLSKTAMKLIGPSKVTGALEEYDYVLRRCAFINIYPFSGEPSASSNFKSVAKALIKADPKEVSITKGSCSEDIACNRKAIILGHNWKYVVTVNGVFDKLCPNPNKMYDGFVSLKNNRPAFDIGETTFIKIHHPNRFSNLELDTMEFKPKK